MDIPCSWGGTADARLAFDSALIVPGRSLSEEEPLNDHRRRAAYAGLWVLALAFGWIEASVVVYLREVSNQGASVLPAHMTLVSMPGHLVAVELGREACTIALLGAAAWLGGSRSADRAGAFLFSFGVWDLTYYGALQLLTGWPGSLSAWDVLFLIPLPWVAPVWAPATVSTLFAAAGSYLFWTPNRPRRYRWADAAVLIASALVIIASFLVESSAAIEHRVPEPFPAWLFWTGVALGLGWFVWIERRNDVKQAAPSWLGVRVRSILPDHPEAPAKPAEVPAKPAGEPAVGRIASSEHAQLGVTRAIEEYTEARQALDRLLDKASELGERLEILARGLSSHPTRMFIGLPDRFIEEPSAWEIVPGHPLPSIDSLVTLTNDIRAAAARVDDLRERLILMGRADVVEEPDVFFH